MALAESVEANAGPTQPMGMNPSGAMGGTAGGEGRKWAKLARGEGGGKPSNAGGSVGIVAARGRQSQATNVEVNWDEVGETNHA